MFKIKGAILFKKCLFVLQQENAEALHELFAMHKIIGENYSITPTIPFVHETKKCAFAMNLQT